MFAGGGGLNFREDLNIEGRLKTPLHTVINVDHKGVNQTTEQVENTET